MNLLPRLCCRSEGFAHGTTRRSHEPSSFLKRDATLNRKIAMNFSLACVVDLKDVHTERQEDNMNLPRS